jgi:hypothetical protein
MQRDLDFSEAAALASPEQKPAVKAPWHLYLIGSAAVLWNALGVFDFLATFTQFEPYMERFPEAARNYLATLPGWVFAIWGAAIVSALAGSLMLVNRQAMAVRVLAVSAVATLFSMAATYTRPTLDSDFDRVSAVFIIVVALLVLNYAFHQAKRGVLR